MPIRIQTHKHQITLGAGISSIYTAEVLNEFFTRLTPTTVLGDTIDVSGNVGSSECDVSIATAKGYTVIID